MREVKERPILMSAEMVRAILDGRKTQTRRPMKPQPITDEEGNWSPVVGLYHPTKIDKRGEEYPGPEVFGASNEICGRVCPFGQPGDRLWVRETFYEPEGNAAICYRADWNPKAEYADGGEVGNPPYWTPSIHMPRWASRILLEIVDVRVERQMDITLADAIAEGFGDEREFNELFLKLYPELGKTNPWVWAYTFRRLKP